MRTPDQLRAASRAWMVVARKKTGFVLDDERAAAVLAARYLRRCAWKPGGANESSPDARVGPA
jgi:hypothetical protein